MIGLPSASRDGLVLDAVRAAATGLWMKRGEYAHDPAAFDWRSRARPSQLAPEGLWRVWLILAGRGWGKTRTGAEWVREQVLLGVKRIALIGPTAADVRDIMVEGESGVLSVFPPHERPQYEPSKRRVTFHTGAIATAYSADEPDRLRGPQHDSAWADELAAWRYPDAWDQLLFGLRLGVDPRAVVTTTPKPTKLIRDLMAEPTTATTRGSTYENRDNLAAAFFSQIVSRYEGTRLGRQELNAEVLEDVEGALWTAAGIENARVKTHPPLQRVVIPIDPAVTAEEGSDETGIVPCGVAMCNCKGTPELHAFVLDDVSGRMSPDGWARAAVAAYDAHQADRIIGEANNGGDLVEANIRTVRRSISYRKVNASRGKRARAEPVAALYEQGKVHHVGTFAKLEDQMTTYVPAFAAKSPDRMDSLVWGLTELMLENLPTPSVEAW